MTTLIQYKAMSLIGMAMNKVKEKFDNAIVECDAWFLVFMAVLLGLAFTIASALAIWCTVYKGKKFTGNWKWYKWGVEVSTECK